MAENEETEDTILDFQGGLTLLDKDVKAFIADLEDLCSNYATDDSWFFEFN